MRCTAILSSLSAFAVAAVSVSAIREPNLREWHLPQQDQLGKRQTRVDTATIPTYNYGPTATVPVAGGSDPVATTTAITTTITRSTLGTTTTTSPAKTKTETTSAIPSGTELSTGTATATATRSIPIVDYFPSSTVPVDAIPTSQPDVENGGNMGDNKGGNGDDKTTGGGNAGQTGEGQTGGGQNDQTREIADLLSRLLDLLGGV